MQEHFEPGPIATHAGNGVAFTASQAVEIFEVLPPGRIVLCVDVPRCLWVQSAYDAIRFYESKSEKE